MARRPSAHRRTRPTRAVQLPPIPPHPGDQAAQPRSPAHRGPDLLGHSSPEVTAIYARYNLNTLRRHWHRAITSPTSHPPAPRTPTPPQRHDKRSLALPVQLPRTPTTRRRCPMSWPVPRSRSPRPLRSPCPDHVRVRQPLPELPILGTDPTYHDQHQRHRDDTARAVDAATRAGLTRAARNNTRTLIALDELLASLDTRRRPQDENPQSLTRATPGLAPVGRRVSPGRPPPGRLGSPRAQLTMGRGFFAGCTHSPERRRVWLRHGREPGQLPAGAGRPPPPHGDDHGAGGLSLAAARAGLAGWPSPTHPRPLRVDHDRAHRGHAGARQPGQLPAS